jgi:putative aldouronate transport system substrate-binding protein
MTVINGKKMKAWHLGLTMVMVATVGLTGCGSKASTTTSSAKPSESTAAASAKPVESLAPVKLKWVLRAAPQKDQQLIQDEMNKILKQKINAEVELQFIDPGAPYDQKVKTMIVAKDDFDIMFTGAPASYGDFYGSVAKGAFLPINDLLKKYAPKAYANIPEEFWKAVTVKGQIYALPNYQIVARQNGVVVQKSLLDKTNFAIDQIKKLEDFEPLLAKVKDEGPNKTGFLIDKTGVWKDSMIYNGLEPVGASSSVGVVRIEDAGSKVINQFADPAFSSHVHLMRDWFQKGYINKDAPTLANGLTMMQSGNVMSLWTNVKPGGKVDTQVNFGNKEVVEKVLDTPFVTTENVSVTLQAINKYSKNPERAMMLLELMNTDKTLYNLISFGIEGKNFTKKADNKIELIKDSGYAPNKSWAFGDQFNAFLLPGQPDTVWQDTIDLNNKAKRSKLLGFVFDQEPVKTEMAQVQAVIDEFMPGLVTGSIDPDKYLPEFLKKLETAGANKIITEKQTQIDAWKAGK